MCEFTLPRCCSCGVGQQRRFKVCPYYLMVARYQMGATGNLPTPGLCPYLKQSEKPTLFAIAHTEDCPMRTALVVYQQDKVYSDEELDDMAQDLYDTFRTNLVNQPFEKIPVPARGSSTVATAAKHDEDAVVESGSSEEESAITLGQSLLNYQSRWFPIRTRRQMPGTANPITRRPVAAATIHTAQQYAIGADAASSTPVPIRREPVLAATTTQPSATTIVIRQQPIPERTINIGSRLRRSILTVGNQPQQGDSSGSPINENSSNLNTSQPSTITEDDTNQVPPGFFQITGSSPHRPMDCANPPRRVWLFRALGPSLALTKGNPMVTIYGNAAPQSASFFCPRVTISSHPEGKVSGMLEGHIGKKTRLNNPFSFANVFTDIRNFFLPEFGLRLLFIRHLWHLLEDVRARRYPSSNDDP